MSSAKPPSRVASLDDLLARCTVAQEQNLSQSSCIQPEQIVSNLGLPLPGDATNADLAGLLPLYNQLLKHLRDDAAAASPFPAILRATTRDAPDAAILLLYLLEFPNAVRTSRGSVSNISACSVDEPFEGVDLVDEIAKNAAILNWCRGALRASGEHHSVVLASCITLLDAVNRLPRQQAKKYIKRNLLSVRKKSSREDIIEGLKLLRSDLADVVVREDAKRDASVNAILLQMHTLVTFFGDDDAVEIMKDLPRKEDFERGIAQHRTSFSESHYQMFRTLLGSDNQSIEETFAASQAVRDREPRGERFQCARDGCTGPGAKRCNRCQLVSYCSKDCQLLDWRARHKKACKKTARSAKASEGAVNAARAIASPALRSQDDFLRQNPQLDYRIVLPTGSQDAGVIFHPVGKEMFKMWRSQAPTPPYLHRMYEMLVENNPDKERIIRRQLQAEYGIDPTSDEAKSTTPETLPMGQQMVDSMMPTMIFYPETPPSPAEAPKGKSVRGAVGHNPMFMVPMNIYEGRIQKFWVQRAAQSLFGEHAAVLLALLDAGIAQNMNETHRAESATLDGNEEILKSQWLDLERRIEAGNESFLLIPLESLYADMPHSLVKTLINVMLSTQGDLAAKIMEGYNCEVLIHKKGPLPSDGSRPPDRDLLGPVPFNCGLRFQCGMTSTVAVMFIHMLLRHAQVSAASEVFIFPHALVFASSNGTQSFPRIMKGVAGFMKGAFMGSVDLWCTSGKECGCVGTDDGDVVKHVSQDVFMTNVRHMGCCWYPAFTETSNSNLLAL